MSFGAARGRLYARKLEQRRLLKGRVREAQQWTLDDIKLVRYDFAFRDPATGRFQQYTVEARFVPWMTQAQYYEQIAEPAVGALARMIERKCGIAEAVKNQMPLSLPRGVVARFV